MMTEQLGPAQPEPGPEPESNPLGDVLVQITAGERLIVIGAALNVILVWILGDILLDEYDIPDVVWILSLGALLAVYFFYNGKRAQWHSFYPWAVAIAAIVVALAGLNDLLEDFRIDYRGGALVFRLGYYIGAGMMGVGGFQVLRNE